MASIQGGAVNLTGKVLFANVAVPGVGAQANLVSAADAKFTNAAGRDYTLQAGSPAIDAATGSTTTVDRLGNRYSNPRTSVLRARVNEAPTDLPPVKLH